ncbi:MAG: RNA methyltransferase, partial [Armatimonadetes bacterium]
TDRVLRSAADAENPRSPVAAVHRPPGASPRDLNTVVLVDIADPGNVGTMIRTAAAFGWDVAVTPRTADVWSPKVLRAGAGAHFSTSIIEVEDPLVFKSSHTVIATEPGGPAMSVRGGAPYAVLIGSEAHGLEPRVVEGADLQLSVPMDGRIESLNASVAAGIAMFIVDHTTSDT